ncbi:hydroxyacylglutathione hydrolase [Methylotenera sp. 1P/1]|uniref:hydroxyacylglutathione hydrolase n=1 Tax=Methylotenera sp. 1P/1 TaxID=1131551 RepID=UPI000372FFE2|nr:hydroxyacylglutathione hydrolase [Methylotenera sp. 1P/1]
MITIFPIPAFEDNYIWVLQLGRNVVVVDPGDATPVLQVLKEKQLVLSAILITHHHLDHIGGVETLLEQYQVPVYAPSYREYPFPHTAIKEGDHVTLPAIEQSFKIMWLPGHTLDHIVYVNDQFLFCGDVLFGAGCGRLFEGSPEQMLHSLQRIKQLPSTTQIFCTHEYTLTNIQFARGLEPNNLRLAQREAHIVSLRKQNIPSLPSTLEEEIATNPFLRCLETEIQQHIKMQNASEIEIFTAIRQLRNHY